MSSAVREASLKISQDQLGDSESVAFYRSGTGIQYRHIRTYDVFQNNDGIYHVPNLDCTTTQCPPSDSV